MKQERVLELLRQAQELAIEHNKRFTPVERMLNPLPSELSQIRELLVTFANRGLTRDERVMTQAFARVLFDETIKKRPENLVNMFPAFAMLCAERNEEEYRFAPIDWDLLD